MNIQIKNPIILLLILLFPFSNLAAEVLYYDTDNVGSPVAMWDKNGNKVWEGEYYPFGEEFRVTDDQIKNKKRLIGKEKDSETGLTYFGARYIDEVTGRFISPDPVRPVDAFTSKTNYTMLVNPQRLNRYTYGLNNPYRYVDPDGNWVEAVFLEGPSIAVGIHSFSNNVKQGNFGSAAIDAGGIVADSVAVAIPGVPGGIGLGLKAKRASDGIFLTKKATRNLGNLTDLKDVDIAQAIRDRGGNASNVRKALGDNFAGKTVGEIANISATKGVDATQAKTAIKILKQAKKKGQRH